MGKLNKVTRFKFDIGQKIGKWTILDNTPIWRDSGYVHFSCQCECGTIRDVVANNLENGVSTNCGCVRKSRGSVNYLGFNNLSMKYFSSLKRGAESRALEFNVSIQYLYSLFTGFCSLSGLPITIERNPDKQSGSVDRIDSSKGYIEGNLQWVDKRINIMKRDFDQEEFITLCKDIASNNE